MTIDSVRPFQKPPRAPGAQPPATSGVHPAAAEFRLSDRHTPASQAEEGNSGPYARTDMGNDFEGNDQTDTRLVGVSEAQWEGTSAEVSDLDVGAYGVYAISLVGSASFSLADPPAGRVDFDEQPLRRAWGIVVYLAYTGAFTPSFDGVIWPDDQEPEWSAQAGKTDVIVLTYRSGTWFGFEAGLGFSE
jgi:hypothetical protein